MEVGRRSAARSGVVAGSVWESRMKSDEIKGGIKVFNGTEENPEDNIDKKLRPKQSPTASGKRKTWKSENSEGVERKPIQIARQRSDPNKNSDEQCKELNEGNGIKRSPVQTKKTRSEVGYKELSKSVDGIEKSPIQKMRTRSEEAKEMSTSVDRSERNLIQIRKVKSNADGIERSPIQLRKAKSDSNRSLDECAGINEGNSFPLAKSKSVPKKVSDEPNEDFDGNLAKLEPDKAVDESLEAIEKNPVEIQKIRSDKCEEKSIVSSLSNLGQVKSAPKFDDGGGGGGGGGGDEGEWDEELDEEIEMETEKQSTHVEEIKIPEQKPKENVSEEKKLHQEQEKPLPIASPTVKKQEPPLMNYSRINQIPVKTKAIPAFDRFQSQRIPQTQAESQRIPQTHSKLRSLVDLVMWRDVSKSAFIFGFGTFIIISSSYTKDLNISLISVFSYLALVYLAAIFLFRSIICRGVIDLDDAAQEYIVGEEDAVWLLKMVLPYLNEFLLNFRALFSGDPATTMKLAVLLFVLARCGSSITIWKMAKLGFFGVFIVPKFCSSYSTQLTAYGKFWVRRFQDAWESCSHKKAVGFGIFTLVWNLSSVIARIWAVFMLFVAFRYYQQSMITDDCVEEEPPKCETTCQGQIGARKLRRVPTTVETTRKEKKRF